MIQANKLSELYRDQVIGVEGELSRLREEDSLNRTMYKERYDDNNDSMSNIAKRSYVGGRAVLSRGEWGYLGHGKFGTKSHIFSMLG